MYLTIALSLLLAHFDEMMTNYPGGSVSVWPGQLTIPAERRAAGPLDRRVSPWGTNHTAQQHFHFHAMHAPFSHVRPQRVIRLCVLCHSGEVKTGICHKRGMALLPKQTQVPFRKRTHNFRLHITVIVILFSLFNLIMDWLENQKSFLHKRKGN